MNFISSLYTPFFFKVLLAGCIVSISTLTTGCLKLPESICIFAKITLSIPFMFFIVLNVAIAIHREQEQLTFLYNILCLWIGIPTASPLTAAIFGFDCVFLPLWRRKKGMLKKFIDLGWHQHIQGGDNEKEWLQSLFLESNMKLHQLCSVVCPGIWFIVPFFVTIQVNKSLIIAEPTTSRNKSNIFSLTLSLSGWLTPSSDTTEKLNECW